MKIADIMTPNPTTVREDSPIVEAAQRMRDEDVGSLPVVKDDGRCVGMVTDRDIALRVVAEGKDPRQTKVSAAMTARFFSCHADDDVSRVEHVMKDRQVRRVPVVDHNEALVGIVSLGDLATGNAPKTEDVLRRVSQPS